jgi:hypothetical protein
MTSLVYPACFLVLATVSGLAAAAGRRWALRLPLLAATPVLALAVWWQLSQRDGWPTGSHPADGAAFVAGVVQAPTPGNAGAVYLWVQPPNSDAPRSYRLPYSRQLERQVAHAASATKQGARVGVRAARKPTRGQRPGGPKSPSGRGGLHTERNPTRGQRAGGSQMPSGSLEFYRLPRPQLEVKGHSS